MQDPAIRPKNEDRGITPWSVAFGSAVAMIVCNGPITLFTFGVLVGSITSQFGWRRATLASAVLAAHIGGAVMMPFRGALLDRFGTRRLVLTSICGFALLFACVALLPANPAAFIAVYALIGVVGAGHSTLPYSRVVSTWFRERRGLALGISLAGVGIGSALIPQVARVLIAHYGWRGAYSGLAVLVLIVALPAVGLLVHDPSTKGTYGLPPRVTTTDSGLSLRQSLSTPQFWMLAIILFLVAAAVNGTTAHLVPMLADRGISTAVATTALSASGLALIGGRVISGFCLDRFYAPLVAAAFFLVPLVGLCLLWANGGIGMSLIAAVLLGTGIGAEVDIMSFLLVKYFGLKHYGSIYGALLALFTLGSGLGPWLVSLPYDHLGSYTLALLGCGLSLSLASGLVVALGPYKFD